MNEPIMAEDEFEEWLAEIIDEGDSALDNQIDEIKTFEEAGVMTLDKGLVVRLRNGQEFQLTITESTR